MPHPWRKCQPTERPEAETAPVRLSGLDKQLIDTTADPCTDFFEYACGNFSRMYPIPNDRSAYGTGAMIADYTEYILHTMLEKAAAGGAGRTPNEQKIGDSYAACMDVDAINQKGLKPLQPEFDRIAALKSKDELPELLARFQLIGANAFMSFGEQQDFKDARKQIAVADQGGLGLPERDYYFRTGDAAEKTRTQYVQHIANMLKLTGEAEDKAASDSKAIMQLETALAKVSMDITSRRDPNKVYHLMPVSELATLAPGPGVGPLSGRLRSATDHRTERHQSRLLQGNECGARFHRSGYDQNLFALAADSFHSRLRFAQGARR